MLKKKTRMNTQYSYHSFNNSSKDNVFAVKPACFYSGDEELWTVGIFSCIGHGHITRSVMFEFEVLVRELISVNTFSWQKLNKNILRRGENNHAYNIEHTNKTSWEKTTGKTSKCKDQIHQDLDSYPV